MMSSSFCSCPLYSQYMATIINCVAFPFANGFECIYQMNRQCKEELLYSNLSVLPGSCQVGGKERWKLPGLICSRRNSGSSLDGSMKEPLIKRATQFKEPPICFKNGFGSLMITMSISWLEIFIENVSLP